METAEVKAVPDPAAPDDELRAWDWRAELKRQDRSVPWLARRTDRSQQTLYQYSSGQTRASLDWLRSAARVLADGPGRSI